MKCAIFQIDELNFQSFYKLGWAKEIKNVKKNNQKVDTALMHTSEPVEKLRRELAEFLFERAKKLVIAGISELTE